MTIGRTTQKQSYEEIKPFAGTKRQQVLEYIKEHPGCTRRQISEAIGLLNSITARVTELLNLRLIVEVNTTYCPMTGKKVATLQAFSGGSHE